MNDEDYDDEIARALAPLRDLPVDGIREIVARGERRRLPIRVLIGAAALIGVAGVIGFATWVGERPQQLSTSAEHGDSATATSSAAPTEPDSGSEDDAAPTNDKASTCADARSAAASDATAAVPSGLIDDLVAAADMAISGQLVQRNSGEIVIKPWRDELGRRSRGNLPSQFDTSSIAGPWSVDLFHDVVLFARADGGRPVILPNGFFIACSDDDPAIVVGGESDWATGPTLADIRSSVWATQRGVSDLTLPSAGDGTSVGRVRLVDGTQFLVRMPTAQADQVTVTQAIIGNERAQIRSPDASLRIMTAFCTDEESSVTERGMLASPIRDTISGPDLSLCLPDLFVRVAIDVVGEHDLDPNDWEVRPLVAGDDYVEWMRSNGMPAGRDECCFDGRFHVIDDTLLLTGGWVDTIVRAHRIDTLEPLWQVDLSDTIDAAGDFVGDASLVWGSTPDGDFVVTTGFGSLVALDDQSGETVWQLDLDDRSPAHFAAAGDGLWIVTSEVRSVGDRTAPVVQAIDPSTGTVRWQSVARELTELQGSPPVVLGDLVLIADVSSSAADPDSPSSAIVAFDLNTGEQRWTASLDSRTEAFSSTDAIVADSTRSPPLLLARNVDGVVFRFDPEDGAELWRAEIGAAEIVGLAPETATITSTAGAQVDVDLDTGVRR